jgi:hypothetical protein
MCECGHHRDEHRNGFCNAKICACAGFVPQDEFHEEQIAGPVASICSYLAILAVIAGFWYAVFAWGGK